MVITLPSGSKWCSLYEPTHDKTNKVAWAPTEDSDQPGHSPSLIRIFSVRMKKAWVLSYPLSTQRRHWSDSDWQAHMPFCWFCHEPAHLLTFISGCVTSFKTSKSWQFDVCCKQKIYAIETKVIPQMGSSASHFPSSRHCNDGWPSR